MTSDGEGKESIPLHIYLHICICMHLHLGPCVGVVIHRGIYPPLPAVAAARLAVTAAVDLAQLPQQWRLPPGSGFGY